MIHELDKTSVQNNSPKLNIFFEHFYGIQVYPFPVKRTGVGVMTQQYTSV